MKRAVHAVCVAGLVLAVLSGAAEAELPELFYDDFDDGDFNGWEVKNAYDAGGGFVAPVVVVSPEGYAVQGVGSGYGGPTDQGSHIAHSLTISNMRELRIEMRAKTGSGPNHVTVPLVSGFNTYYAGRIFGQADKTADYLSYIDSQDNRYRHSIGDSVFEWHTYAWTRDTDWWWSLSIDDVVIAPDFHQDDQLTSFYQIGIELLKEQSQIEWVRISGIPEPTTLSLLALGGLAVLRRRKRRECK
ncbi:MAG: PEP-CTERM sorting domain-containing protein [SAR202 cluster bacterium]|jgi:hypothetical protein|nr:PEP-CTERM sorting domain-containing protein [SAR202 cluster bacterium]